MMFTLIKPLLRIGLIALLAFLTIACASSLKNLRATSETQQGKRYFEQGYYKSAMRELLPIACDGSPEAQYAVGYMYYYGYGVAQDTDVGDFWINRSAKQGYQPAIHALEIMTQEKAHASSYRSPYAKISPHYN